MMRGQSPLTRSVRRAAACKTPARPAYVCWQCRTIQISAAPTTESPKIGSDVFGAPSQTTRDSADARFEVLGSPYSLLSVTLSASQKLYTRRGTLVSVAGQVENAQSTLTLLSPLRRGLLGIPFLYQRITSTTPITALIASSSPTTSFSILHLDGTTDWIVAQRNALLAWTGHTLTPSPRIQRGLSLAHWGSTHLTGRGLAALSSPGQTYQLSLSEGEEIILHPGHVVAYSLNRNPPRPFRLRSTSLRLQVPGIPASISGLPGRLVPAGLSRFWNNMRDTSTYRYLARLLFAARTAARRGIWGDRLFLQFRGPMTVVMSSRGARVRDVLSREQVAEIADVEAGVVPDAVELAARPPKEEKDGRMVSDGAVAVRVASVGRDGKVVFEEGTGLREFVK